MYVKSKEGQYNVITFPPELLSTNISPGFGMQILMFGGNYRKPLIKMIKDRGWRDFKGLQPNELLGTRHLNFDDFSHDLKQTELRKL